MKPKLQVLEQTIATMTNEGGEYICITDIAKYKNSARSDDLIRNWLRNLIPSNSTGIKKKQD